MRYFHLFCFLYYCSALSAQQLPLLDSAHDLYDFLNPAARDNYYLIYGDDNESNSWKWGHSIGLIQRNQWLGQDIRGAPSTSGIKGNAVLENTWILGLGVLTDKVGPFRNTKVYLKGARNLFPNADGKHSFNLGLALMSGYQSAISKSSLSINDQRDPLFIGSKYFEGSSYTAASVGFQGHFSFNKSVKILAGGAISQLGSQNISGEFDLKPHYYGQAGVLLGKNGIVELAATMVYTTPIWHTNYRVRYHWDVVDKYFGIASLGAAFTKQDENFTVQLEIASLVKEGEIRVGLLIDLFRPKFKSVTVTAPSLEVQVSWYLFQRG